LLPHYVLASSQAPPLVSQAPRLETGERDGSNWSSRVRSSAIKDNNCSGASVCCRPFPVPAGLAGHSRVAENRWNGVMKPSKNTWFSCNIHSSICQWGEREREKKTDIQRVWDKCFFLIVAISARMKPAVGGVNVPCIYTRMPRGIYCWRIRSLLLCLCEVFRALINSLVRWFHTGALGHVLLQILAVCFCPNGLYWNVRWWNLFSLFQPSAVRVSLLFLSKWLTFSFLFFFPVEELIMLYTTGCLGMYAAWFFIIVVVVFESVPSSSFLPPPPPPLIISLHTVVVMIITKRLCHQTESSS